MTREKQRRKMTKDRRRYLAGVVDGEAQEESGLRGAAAKGRVGEGRIEQHAEGAPDHDVRDGHAHLLLCRANGGGEGRDGRHAAH